MVIGKEHKGDFSGVNWSSISWSDENIWDMCILIYIIYAIEIWKKNTLTLNFKTLGDWFLLTMDALPC